MIAASIMPSMIAGERYSERLEPHIGFPLAAAMTENQKLLIAAEKQVDGDMQRACDLVEIENCEEPKLAPNETRMAAYLILITAQQEWFGNACTSPDGTECYTLANVTDTGLVLMRREPDDTTTLLQAAPSLDKQVRVSKTRYNIYENVAPYDMAINTSDKRVMAATTRRLRNVNLKWHRLLKEHPGAPPEPDTTRLPLPRMASKLS